MPNDSRPPYFPFYPADFVSDGKVEAMTTVAVGAYLLLLCKAWRENPPATIPDNDAILAKWARISDEDWLECKPLVLAAWVFCKDGRWLQKRLRLEYDKFRRHQEKRSVAGKKGANKRWKSDGVTQSNTKANMALPCDCQGNAIDLPLANDSSSSSSSSSEKEEIK